MIENGVIVDMIPVDPVNAAGYGRAFQRAGRTDLVRVVEGRGRATITFAPRLDFGRIATRITAVEGGLSVEGARDPIVLVAPGVSFEIADEGIDLQQRDSHGVYVRSDFSLTWAA